MSYSNGGSHSRTPEPYYNQNQQTPSQLPNRNLNHTPAQTPGGAPVKVQPLLCSGHTRPVVHLQFSNMSANFSLVFEWQLTCSLDDGTYHMISACKDGNPMLRSWIGDWIGTFLGQLYASCFRVKADMQDIKEQCGRLNYH